MNIVLLMPWINRYSSVGAYTLSLMLLSLLFQLHILLKIISCCYVHNLRRRYPILKEVIHNKVS